jgi:hypothetical protein
MADSIQINLKEMDLKCGTGFVLLMKGISGGLL